MQYSAVAILAAVAGVSASYYEVSKNVTVVTEVVESYVTYCPYPTEITHGDVTYTVTEPTTLTITDCPCTITKPVITSTSSICYDCPSYTNSTAIVTVPTSTPVGTGSVTPTEEPTSVPTGGANKAALSGAGLAGLVGLAAFML